MLKGYLSLQVEPQKNKIKILKAIDQIEAKGDTNIGGAMTTALQVLMQRRYINDQTCVFLLSDGKDTTGENAFMNVKSIIDWSAFHCMHDYIINTYGYGNDNDSVTLNNISNLKNGNFYFVENSNMIDEFFGESIGSIMTTIGQNAVINITTVQSNSFNNKVMFEKIYGGKEMRSNFRINNDNTECSTLIKKLMIGTSRDFLFQLQIPELADSLIENQAFILVSATAQIESIDGKTKIEKTANFKIMISNYEEKIEDNLDFAFHLYRLKVGEVVEEARFQADQQNYGSAKNILFALIEEMKNIKQDEKIKLLMLELGTAIRDISPQVYQITGKKNICNTFKSCVNQVSMPTSNLKSINSNKLNSKINCMIQSNKKY